MPGPNEPGYNVLHAPGTRAPKAWEQMWRSITKFDYQRAKQTARLISAVRSGK